MYYHVRFYKSRWNNTHGSYVYLVSRILHKTIIVFFTNSTHKKRSLLPSPQFCIKPANILCKQDMLMCYAPYLQMCYATKLTNLTCQCAKLFHTNSVCNKMRFLSKHVMSRIYSSVQTPSCFVPTLTRFVGCAWIFMIAFDWIMYQYVMWCIDVLLHLMIMLIMSVNLRMFTTLYRSYQCRPTIVLYPFDWIVTTESYESIIS